MVAHAAMTPTETAGDTANGLEPARAPSARTTSQPGTKRAPRRAANAGRVLHQLDQPANSVTMAAILSGRRDFAAPRVRAYDGRRSRVLRLARTQFARLLPGQSRGAPQQSQHSSTSKAGWGACRRQE